MSQAIEQYVDRVIIYANPSEAEEASLRSELEDHLYTKVEELVEQGETREDAVFQAIEAQGHPDTVGYGLRKFRWVDVRTKGTARGFIAIGPKAVGVFAFGGAAFGVFAFGGFSAGLFSFGGFALALLMSYGGVAISLGFAYGGVVMGLLAVGAVTFGLCAMGAVAVGVYAKGAVFWSLYPFQGAPDWIQTLSNPDHAGYFFITITIASMVLMFVFIGCTVGLQVREYNRIRWADPRLLQ